MRLMMPSVGSMMWCDIVALQNSTEDVELGQHLYSALGPRILALEDDASLSQHQVILVTVANA
jgi:hypothetical protein